MIHVHVYTWCVCAHTRARTHVCMCGSWRSVLSDPQSLFILFFETGSLVKPGADNSARLDGASYPHTVSSEIADLCCHISFFLGAGNLNLGPYTCATNTFSD